MSGRLFGTMVSLAPLPCPAIPRRVLLPHGPSDPSGAVGSLFLCPGAGAHGARCGEWPAPLPRGSLPRGLAAGAGLPAGGPLWHGLSTAPDSEARGAPPAEKLLVPGRRAWPRLPRAEPGRRGGSGPSCLALGPLAAYHPAWCILSLKPSLVLLFLAVSLVCNFYYWSTCASKIKGRLP